MSQIEPAASFTVKTVSSINAGTFVRLVLSGAVTPGEPDRILGRLIQLRGKPHLSLTLRHATRDQTENLALSDVEDWLEARLRGQYTNALLGTTTRDWQLTVPSSGAPRLVGHKPAVKTPPPTAHDRQRTTWLDDTAADWLTRLGILGSDGRVRSSMADKHRQISHYLEIVAHLARDCGWRNPGAQPAELRVADMGCGKGYLTFGLWQLFSRNWKQPIHLTGVEVRPELVRITNEIARNIGAAGLKFVCGSIATTPFENLDALIALHACDTATDDAIRRGIELKAKLIVVAPCCHQATRPQLGRPEPLAALLEHGLLEERFAEWITDGLRALYLQESGYRTKIIEFVGGEHTPKNLMIAAVRQHAGKRDQQTRERILALKQHLGIQQFALDDLLEADS